MKEWQEKSEKESKEKDILQQELTTITKKLEQAEEEARRQQEIITHTTGSASVAEVQLREDVVSYKKQLEDGERAQKQVEEDNQRLKAEIGDLNKVYIFIQNYFVYNSPLASLHWSIRIELDESLIYIPFIRFNRYWRVPAMNWNRKESKTRPEREK